MHQKYLIISFLSKALLFAEGYCSLQTHSVYPRGPWKHPLDPLFITVLWPSIWVLHLLHGSSRIIRMIWNILSVLNAMTFKGIFKWFRSSNNFPFEKLLQNLLFLFDLRNSVQVSPLYRLLGFRFSLFVGYQERKIWTVFYNISRRWWWMWVYRNEARNSTAC